MAHLGSYLPTPGSAVWRRDVGSPTSSNSHQQGVGAGAGDSSRVRHVVIRDAEIWEEPAPYVVYRINVLTEHDHWFLFRRYSQFHSLHKKLVRQYGVNSDLLPPKKMSGNLSKQLIDKRRKLLEGYLQKIIHMETQVSRSPELQVFLDTPTHNVIKVTDILTRHLYLHGDLLLQDATPIALSVNEMYAITQRLTLPRDAKGIDAADVSADPAHLYSFVHQLERLRVSLPPTPCSVSCSTFDLGPFRSLHTLKLDHVPMAQVGGLVLIQQQLERVSVHRTLHSPCELLVDAVEEKRNPDNRVDSAPPLPPADLTESWRLSATAKLMGTRVVVQPWRRLHTLTLSHNIISQLDTSLQVLPVLRELTLSYNQLEVLPLQYLCLPSLEKLNVSHNKIHTIEDNGKVLERITHLSLSHNRLRSLDGITAFVGTCVINLSFNLISSSDDLSKLVLLRRLDMLSTAGNPISSSSAFRIVMLAKFLRKSRNVSIDGEEATPKEKAKIKSYSTKYGVDPDLWPVAKTLQPHNPSHRKKPHPLSSPAEHGVPRPGSTTPTTSHVDLTWQGQHSDEPHPSSRLYATPPGKPTPPSARSNSIGQFSFASSSNDSLDQSYRKGNERLLHTAPGRRRGSTTPQQPRPRTQLQSRSFSGGVNEEERFSAGAGHGGVVSHRGQGPTKGFVPRSEPDGQSDVSSTSPDITQQRARKTSPYHSTIAPPPCTPIPADEIEREVLATPITPAMLQSALDALEGIQDKDTPLSLTPHQHFSDSGQSPVLPEAVATALTTWISSQSLQGAGTVSASHSKKSTPFLTPPPSTPGANSSFDQSDNQGISAGDLIAALSTLKVLGGEGTPGSRGSGGGYSVPTCTPNEGGVAIEGWAKLGIKPTAVIQALSALTIQQEEEEEEEEHRICEQHRGTPSPIPPEMQVTPTVSADSATLAPDQTNFLCLFPESKDTPEVKDTPLPPEVKDTPLPPGYEEVKEEGLYYFEDVDESVIEHHLSHLSPSHQVDHTHSMANEFEELDPYMMSHHLESSTQGGIADRTDYHPGLEVGVEIVRDTANLDPMFQGSKQLSSSPMNLDPTVQGSELVSSSPLESVLYSH